MNKSEAVEIEPPFTYQLEGHCCYSVKYQGPQDTESTSLGMVAQRQTGPYKDKWFLYSFAHSYADRLGDPNHAPVFETREQAAKALFVVRKSIEKNPLSDSVREWFSRKDEWLRERRKVLTNELFAVQREMFALQTIAGENGLEYDFGVDIRKELSDLKEFMAEYDTSFYENQGKGFARQFKSLVSNVVGLVDAEAAAEIW